MKRLLLAFTAVAALSGPLAAPIQALAQDQPQPGRERPSRGGDGPRAMRPDRPAMQERPSRPEISQPRPDRPSRPEGGWSRPDRPATGGDRPNRPDGGWNRPDRPDTGGNRPDRPDNGGVRPDRPDNGWNRPDRPNNGGNRPDRPDNGWNRPDRPNNGGNRPDRPDNGWNRPDRPNNGGNRPDRPDNGWNRPDRPGNGWNRPDRPGNNWNRERDRERMQREFRQRFNSNQWRRDFYRDRNPNWWRNDNRFRGYSGVRVGFYFAPGWGYYSVPRSYWGRYWSPGQYLPDIFWRYQLNDWRTYGLGYPPPGTQWVAVDNTIYLIDDFDGYIIDVVRNAWSW